MFSNMLMSNKPTAPGGVGYPSGIPRPVREWEASSIIGLVDGDAIASCPDTSNTNDPLVATSQPTYKMLASGKPTMRFQANNFNFTEMANIKTALWVVREGSVSNGSRNGSRCLLGHAVVYNFYRGYQGQIWNSIFTSYPVRSGTTKLNGSVINGTTTKIPLKLSVISCSLNGSAKANTVANDRGYPQSAWVGDISAILLYDVNLSANEITTVENYLSLKNSIGNEIELLHDGSFALANQTYWPNGFGTPIVTFPNGTIQLQTTGSFDSVAQAFTTSVGQEYLVVGEMIPVISSSIVIKSDSATNYNINRVTLGSGGTSVSHSFVATSTTTYLHLLSGAFAGDIAGFDNMSVFML